MPRPEQVALFIRNVEKEFGTVARVADTADIPGAIADFLAQKNLDIAREDFLARQAYPQEQIKAMTGALQGVQPAVPQAATKVGTEVPGAFQPSLLGTVGQAYATYKGLGGK